MFSKVEQTTYIHNIYVASPVHNNNGTEGMYCFCHCLRSHILDWISVLFRPFRCFTCDIYDYSWLLEAIPCIEVVVDLYILRRSLETASNLWCNTYITHTYRKNPNRYNFVRLIWNFFSDQHHKMDSMRLACAFYSFIRGHLRCTISHCSQQQHEIVTKVVVVVMVVVDIDDTLED